MAQVNIGHFTKINSAESKQFSKNVLEIVAWEVHHIKPAKIEPDTVSILVVPIDQAASLSGADSEVQVLVSGNNWPKHENGSAFDFIEAKTYFDNIAENIHKAISEKTNRKVYIWVTPFTATGWGE